MTSKFIAFRCKSAPINIVGEFAQKSIYICDDGVEMNHPINRINSRLRS